MQREEVLIQKQRSPLVGGYAIAKSVRAHRCARQIPTFFEKSGILAQM
ncbi:hypothetical protein [Nostoc sp.]